MGQDTAIKTIAEFPAYRITSDGQVIGTRGKALRAGGVERPIVILYRDGKSYARQVSHLVLEAFVGPAPQPESCALHWDDNAWNNQVDNLRWGTREDNIKDAFRNTGKRPGFAPTLAEIPDEILFSGSARVVASRLGVGSHTTVLDERRRRNG